MQPSTQNREQVSVSHIDLPQIDWDTASGGDRSHTSTKVRPAAGKPKVVLSGDSEFDNVTTTAFVDPVAHATLLSRLHAGWKFEGATVTRQFIDADGIPVGVARTWLDCSVAKSGLTDADANGEDGAKLTVEWLVGG